MKNLMDKNKNAYQYQEAIEIQFQSICEPLYNLEIKWFGYIKIFPDGSYLNLSPSNKEFIRKYFSTINYQGITPTQEIGSSLFGKSHYAMYASDTLLQNEMKDPILSLAYFYNIWPVFCIYKNSSYFMEVYCFSKNNKDHYSTNFYLNNLDIFENFCDYFDVCAKDIINCTDKNKLGYFDQQFNFKNQLHTSNILQ